jgi:hypothetical protein
MKDPAREDNRDKGGNKKSDLKKRFEIAYEGKDKMEKLLKQFHDFEKLFS